MAGGVGSGKGGGGGLGGAASSASGGGQNLLSLTREGNQVRVQIYQEIQKHTGLFQQMNAAFQRMVYLTVASPAQRPSNLLQTPGGQRAGGVGQNPITQAAGGISAITGLGGLSATYGLLSVNPFAVQRLVGSIRLLANAIGTEMLPAARDAAGFIQQLYRSFGELDPSVRRAIGYFTFWAAAGVGVVFVLGQVVGGIRQVVTAAAFLVTTPWGLAITAVGTLVGLSLILANNFGAAANNARQMALAQQIHASGLTTTTAVQALGARVYQSYMALPNDEARRLWATHQASGTELRLLEPRQREAETWLAANPYSFFESHATAMRRERELRIQERYHRLQAQQQAWLSLQVTPTPGVGLNFQNQQGQGIPPGGLNVPPGGRPWGNGFFGWPGGQPGVGGGQQNNLLEFGEPGWRSQITSGEQLRDVIQTDIIGRRSGDIELLAQRIQAVLQDMGLPGGMAALERPTWNVSVFGGPGG